MEYELTKSPSIMHSLFLPEDLERIVLLSKNDIRDIEKQRASIPSLTTLIRNYYGNLFFETGVVKPCLLITGRESKKAKAYIHECFLNDGQYPHRSSKGPCAKTDTCSETSCFIFPRFVYKGISTLPLLRVSSEAVAGSRILHIRGNNPLVYAVLASRMFLEFRPSNSEGGEFTLDNNGKSSFPWPKIKELPDGFLDAVSELRKHHEKLLERLRKTGRGNYEEHISADMRVVLAQINDFVDNIYPGYVKGMDRAEYLDSLRMQ